MLLWYERRHQKPGKSNIRMKSAAASGIAMARTRTRRSCRDFSRNPFHFDNMKNHQSCRQGSLLCGQERKMDATDATALTLQPCSLKPVHLLFVSACSKGYPMSWSEFQIVNWMELKGLKGLKRAKTDQFSLKKSKIEIWTQNHNYQQCSMLIQIFNQVHVCCSLKDIVYRRAWVDGRTL